MTAPHTSRLRRPQPGKEELTPGNLRPSPVAGGCPDPHLTSQPFGRRLPGPGFPEGGPGQVHRLPPQAWRGAQGNWGRRPEHVCNGRPSPARPAPWGPRGRPRGRGQGLAQRGHSAAFRPAAARQQRGRAPPARPGPAALPALRRLRLVSVLGHCSEVRLQLARRFGSPDGGPWPTAGSPRDARGSEDRSGSWPAHGGRRRGRQGRGVL